MTCSAHIVVAGGGVAALEAVAALRALLGRRPEVTLIAPGTELVAQAASVGMPFGWGLPPGLSYEDVSKRAPFSHRRTTISSVDAGERVVVCADGGRIGYDHLIVAVGARPEPSLPGATTFTGARDSERVMDAVESSRRLAFVLPSPSTWALPVYELATMTAVQLRGRQPEITVVTAEPSPLWAFGPEASEAMEHALAERGIRVRPGVRALAVRAGELELSAGPPVRADRVIALPRLKGPALASLPHDADGFIPVDAHGCVAGVTGVYAAGDATTFPLKQGGLATQQADAVAETLAAELGVIERAEPFRPVLRGLLLTGGAPLYLRSRLTPFGEPGGTFSRPTRRPAAAVSGRPLWWPPTKIAGRYLAPLMATARPPVLATAPLQDLTAAARGGHDDALELALMLAEEDAAAGDYRQAVHALDAAAALTGGPLPPEWTGRREQWLEVLREL